MLRALPLLTTNLFGWLVLLLQPDLGKVEKNQHKKVMLQSKNISDQTLQVSV